MPGRANGKRTPNPGNLLFLGQHGEDIRPIIVDSSL